MKLVIPEPGSSNARSASWLGFPADCECHVVDNGGEATLLCDNHIPDHDGSQPDQCSHIIHPDCGLHRGWTPGDTAEVESPRWGAWADGTVPPEHADAHQKWMADHA